MVDRVLRRRDSLTLILTSIWRSCEKEVRGEGVSYYHGMNCQWRDAFKAPVLDVDGNVVKEGSHRWETWMQDEELDLFQHYDQDRQDCEEMDPIQALMRSNALTESLTDRELKLQDRIRKQYVQGVFLDEKVNFMGKYESEVFFNKLMNKEA